MFDPVYRIWLIKYLAQTFFPPIALCYLLSIIVQSGIWRFFAFSACFIATPFFWATFGYLQDWRDIVNAKKLGARVVPLIRGKRFGDVDLIAKWANGIQKGYIGAIFDELLDEAGTDTARLSLLGVDRIITRDHDVMKFVLSTGFPFFEKGETGALRSGSFFGKGIFTADGDQAKMHRALARPYFARERISEYESFAKYTNKLIVVLGRAISSGEPIDVQDMFARFTMDTAGEFLFGTSDLNTLDLPFPKASEAVLGPKGIATDTVYGGFVQAFEQGQINTHKRVGQPIPFWAAREFIVDSQTETAKVIQEFLEPLARKALERKAQVLASGEKMDEESFLDHLALSTDDVTLVKDQLLNMMLAARDTTAGLLSFTCYLLAMYPDVMSRLRTEVLTAFGPTGLPTYDSLKTLKYLRAVLNESLRIFPPVPLNLRSSKGPTIIPTRQGPLYIPRQGWQITWSVAAIHKRKDLWGDDADDFVPERWMGERAKDIAADPFQFIPFNAGPRICLGQQFAYNEASFVLVRLLQVIDNFTVAQAEAAPAGSLPPDEWKLRQGRQAIEKIHPQSAMTLYSKGGLWLRMHLASSSGTDELPI
ncbi:hypothetical protein FRB94_013977 [Tulasnella sp. JGI-2019a]|nr:hypothetical protein FRB94_013977 [Tulasnella sp. JGI-2019a]